MMELVVTLCGVAVLLVLSQEPAWARESFSFTTSAGELRVTPMGHGSLMLEFQDTVVHVDPYSKAANYSRAKKADSIWITHEHFDHLDLEAIDHIKRDDTVFVADPVSATKLGGQVITMRNGDRQVVHGITLEAVPAYNVVRERAPGVKYHPKGFGNGYVATWGGFRLYIAGDTEMIPEMASLADIDLAFVPVLPPYTMLPEEAAQAVRVFSPRRVVPYHTDHQKAKQVAALLQDAAIEVKVTVT